MSAGWKEKVEKNVRGMLMEGQRISDVGGNVNE
jgi:hypothetical protein